MRRALTIASHPLTILLAALGLNLYNDHHDRPTICRTARKIVPWPLFVLFWARLTWWMVPHYCRPLMRGTLKET